MSSIQSTARKPVRYARANPAPAALLLFFVIVGLATVRAGRLPNSQEAASLAIASVVVVLAASVAPELVTMGLGAALVLSILRSEPFVLTLASRASNAFNGLGG